MAEPNEQWQGDWMHDAETGQIVDGPILGKYEMFILIRMLRRVVLQHAQTIERKEELIQSALKRVQELESTIRQALSIAKELGQ